MAAPLVDEIMNRLRKYLNPEERPLGSAEGVRAAGPCWARRPIVVQNPPLKPSYAADLSVFRGGEPQGVRLSPLQPDAETGGRSPWPGGRQCPWTEMSWDTTPCLLMARNLSPADNIYTSISCN